MHSQAVQLLQALFPPECPLLNHVSQTYEKRFLMELHEIPEATETRVRRRPSSKARTSRLRKNTGEFPCLQDTKRTIKSSSNRNTTRSQSALRTYDRPKSASRRMRIGSEPQLVEKEGRKKTPSRSRLETLRDRRNQSAELGRRSTEPEESSDRLSPSQFFIS